MKLVMTDAPVVVLLAEGEPTDSEHLEGLGRLSQLLRTMPVVAFVFEDAGGARLTMEQRRRQARWMKDEAALLEQRCVGIAFVFPTAGARFVLSSILLLTGSPTPYAVMADRTSALKWARDRLRERGSSREPTAPR